jgi:hypothetical protein
MVKDCAIDMGDFTRLAMTIKPPELFHHLGEMVFFDEVAFQEMTVVQSEFAGSRVSISRFYRQLFFNAKGFKKELF